MIVYDAHDDKVISVVCIETSYEKLNKEKNNSSFDFWYVTKNIFVYTIKVYYRQQQGRTRIRNMNQSGGPKFYSLHLE